MTNPELLIPFLLPPVVGAAIGYFTNAVAIRMLFRPLTRKQVLGIRIPFTPGVIPRQRAELAHSIARMVSQRLLTEDVLLKQIRSEAFYSGVESAISGYTTHLLNSVPTPSLSGEPRRFLRHAETGLESVLERFLRSDVFETMIQSASGNLVRLVYDADLSSLVTDPAQTGNLAGYLFRILTEETAIARYGVVMREHLDQAVQENRTIARYLGPEFPAVVRNLADHLYDPILQRILEWIRTPGMRDELSRRGQVILGRIFDRLSSVQRFFVSAAQYDRGVRDQMPQIIDDLTDHLEQTLSKPESKKRLLGLLEETLEELRNEELGAIFLRYRLTASIVTDAAVQTARKILGRREIERSIESAVERWLTKHSDLAVSELLEGKVRLSREVVATSLSSTIRRVLGGPEMPRKIAAGSISFLQRFLESSGDRSLGSLVGVGAAEKKSLDRLVTRRTLQLVESRLPQIIGAVDVYSLVVEKIDSLDVADVEKLLLMVIARHLKWINLFGGILGFLIGASQVLITYVY